MRRRQAIGRMISIQRVLMKYGLDEFIKETHLLRPLRFVFYVLPRRRDTSAPLGERIRLALEELGPIFVKFGQAISTRRDLLPTEIADDGSRAGGITTTIFDLVRQYGGTISAEHGVGVLKKDYLLRYRDEAEIALMRTLKQALDPKGLLNPGKIFDA